MTVRLLSVYLPVLSKTCPNIYKVHLCQLYNICSSKIWARRGETEWPIWGILLQSMSKLIKTDSRFTPCGTSCPISSTTENQFPLMCLWCIKLRNVDTVIISLVSIYKSLSLKWRQNSSLQRSTFETSVHGFLSASFSNILESWSTDVCEEKLNLTRAAKSLRNTRYIVYLTYLWCTERPVHFFSDHSKQKVS